MRASLIVALMLCVGCSTYSVQQTSLVPPAIMTPTPASTEGADIAMLGSFITTTRDRDQLKDASLWVARGQVVGTFEYAFRPASIRLTGFSAPARGAYRAQPDGFRNPGGSAYGAGPGAVI